MTKQTIKLDEKDRKIINLLHENQDIRQEEITKIIYFMFTVQDLINAAIKDAVFKDLFQINFILFNFGRLFSLINESL